MSHRVGGAIRPVGLAATPLGGAGAVVASLGGSGTGVVPITGAVASAATWQATAYASFAFAAAAVAVVFAAVMWRSVRGPGTVALTALALGAAWWSLLYGLELSSATLATKLLFGRLSYLGIVTVPVAWFAFALAYTGRGRYLTPSTVGVLSSPAVIAAALPWTSGSNDLFWAATTLVSRESGVLLAVEYGPVFWLWSAYGYVLLGAGTFLLLWSVPSDARLFRAQTALLVVGVTAPWLANLTYLSRLFGPGTLDLTPLGFVVSALALGAGIRRFGLLDVHPAVRAFAHEALAERVAEPVLVLTDDGRILDLNRSARSVLGVGVDDVVGTPLDDTAPDLAEAIDGAADGTATLTAGRPPRHYEVRASTLRGDGEVVGRLVMLGDVTERRRRERQLAVLDRVLRHDLRNDIATVQAAAELLADEPDNERYVRIVTEKSREMGDLVRTVSAVRRTLEAGGPTLSDVDIVRVVDERVETARRSHPEATVTTDLPGTERVRSTDLVSSVIDNLIENAIEHNDTDAPHVRVSVDRVVDGDDGRPYVEVRVADDGPGIPAPDRDVLVGDEGTGLEDASGLGLWLVNWLVTESGGEVRYEPNEPRGSVVVVRLPPAERGGEGGENGYDRMADLDSTTGWASRHPASPT